MTTINFKDGRVSLPAQSVRGFVADACDRLKVSRDQLAAMSGADLSSLDARPRRRVPYKDCWPLVRFGYEERELIKLLPAHGVPAFNYDLVDKIDLDRGPAGFTADFESLKLEVRKTRIAGHEIDFPIGVPASILTTNSSFLRYYAQRGYSILTYKTVRSRPHDGNTYPQWFCLEEPDEFEVGSDGALLNQPKFYGRLRRFPLKPSLASMANSFGVPSLPPERWQDDLQEARSFIERGRQLLIVSVMSSVDSDLNAIKNDFSITAKMAVECGADVIELNFSCPNTRQKEGQIYMDPVAARDIAAHVKAELRGSVPIFTKIGHLSDGKLRQYVEHTWDVVDGIVGINTISAPVLNAEYGDERPAFRKGGGVSGWAVQKAAHHFAKTLVELRDEIERRHRKRLDILAVGGVMTRSDFNKRLALGVDAVGICTGTYFNPMLGFECRNAQGKVELRPRPDSMVEGASATMASGANALPSPGASSRARERSAHVSESPDEERRLPRRIDPVEAKKDIIKYYEKTAEADVLRDQEEWMASVLEHYASNES